MNLTSKQLASFGAGLFWAMLAVTSAHADDTELFVGNAAAAATTKPNILLIFDNSLSMNSDVITQNDYDPATTYPSQGCSTSRVYFSTSGNPPDCSYTNNYFNLSALLCQRAIDAFNTPKGGTYTDYVAQYDEGVQQRWETINAYQKNYVIECQDDRPDPSIGWAGHGDGVNTSKVYARSGTPTAKWTSIASQEISWGQTPVAQTYTLYSGNYMNWYYGAASTSTRFQVMKDVATNLVSSINGVNFGLMTFEYQQGGAVRQPMTEVTTGRTALVNAINNLTLNGYTPLSETLDEAYRYLTGSSVNYGTTSVSGSLDPKV